MFQRLYSPKYAIGRIKSLQASGQPGMLFPVALFSHPGYTNMLFTDLMADGASVGVLVCAHGR